MGLVRFTIQRPVDPVSVGVRCCIVGDVCRVTLLLLEKIGLEDAAGIVQSHAYHPVVMKLVEWNSIHLECRIRTYEHATGCVIILSWYDVS